MTRLILVLLLTLPACGMIPADIKDTLDRTIKDNGAGHYYLACQVGKDGQQLGGVKTDMECTADMLQLTGCHKKGFSFEGPK